MVFETLVEYGFPGGILEAQRVNLMKAVKELAFTVGKGLTEELRHPEVILKISSSKTALQYIEENLLSVIITGKEAATYFSEFKQRKSKKTTVVKVASAILPKQKGTSNIPRYSSTLSST